jgi:hypothetical protein
MRFYHFRYKKLADQEADELGVDSDYIDDAIEAQERELENEDEDEYGNPLNERA